LIAGEDAAELLKEQALEATPVWWWRGSRDWSGKCLGTTEASATTANLLKIAGKRIASIHNQPCSAHSNPLRLYREVCSGMRIVSGHQHEPTPLTRDCRKIPWRLSAPQKLRQRRRLRRVDNIVSVLDSALQRQVQSQPATTATKGIGATQATTEELAQTAQGQRLMNAEVNTPLNDRRHGRGPKQGEILSGSLPMGTVTMTADQARKMGTIKLIERWKAEMPTEAEMLPRDKYTMFDRKEKKYRKGIHSKSPPISLLAISTLLTTFFRAA
jgi:hypothetical protein